jgi:hypothetical protein
MRSKWGVSRLRNAITIVFTSHLVATCFDRTTIFRQKNSLSVVNRINFRCIYFHLKMTKLNKIVKTIEIELRRPWSQWPFLRDLVEKVLSSRHLKMEIVSVCETFCFIVIYNFGRWTKTTNSGILSVIYRSEKPLEKTAISVLWGLKHGTRRLWDSWLGETISSLHFVATV